MDQLMDILHGIRPEGDFLNSNDFITEGLLDSFDVITLVTSIEEVYGISIAGEDVIPENFNNLNALKSFIKRHIDENN